jgi:hypothetical protein
MKAKKDLRKPEKRVPSDSDDLKLGRKLKPVKKEKNVKRALFQEIDELEDLEMDYLTDDLTNEFDDEDEEE